MALRVSILFMFALCFCQATARADQNEADAQINQGLKAMRKGDYQAALEAFRRAHQSRPTPRSHTEIGLAKQGLRLWVEAEADLADSLAETGDAWLEEHRPIIEKALADVRSHLGQVTVESGPRQAEVFIDGRSYGQLPLAKPIYLLPGIAIVKITATGRLPWHTEAQINPGETTRLAPIFEPLDLPPPPAAAVTVAVPKPTTPPRLVYPTALKVIGWIGLIGGAAAVASGFYFLNDAQAGSPAHLTAFECFALGGAIALGGGTIVLVTALQGSDATQGHSNSAGLSISGRF
jgi:hypothetical protein